MNYKELKVIRNLFGMKRPISKKVASSSDIPWDYDYWETVKGLYATGAGMFLLGLLLAILVAGIGLIVLAALMWVFATLMVITYPLWAMMHYIFDKV
jgi:hypothetical protein